MDRKDTIIISVSVDRELNNKIEQIVSNKSKLTEWLLIRFLEENNVDVIKKIMF